MISSYFHRLSGRERAISYLCISIIGLALFLKFVIQPFKNFYQGLQNQIESKEIRLAKDIKLVHFKESAVQMFEKFSASRAVGTSEQEMSRFLKEIETLARKSSLHILDLRPLPVNGKEFYQKFSVELQSESSMGSLINFLYQLQNSSLILKVQKFRLSASQGEAGESNLKAHFTITRVLVTGKSE